VKQDTLISLAILTVVTVVVLGVVTSGFGLFRRAETPTPKEMMALIWGANVGPAEGNPAARAQGPGPVNALPGLVAPGALPIAVPMEAAAEALAPAPPNFVPETLQLYEAHWQGMDVRLLTSELRRKLRYPVGLAGILVGEVTLAAARAGLLGGDVIIAVEGQPVTELAGFQEATRVVANRTQASLTVLRKSGVIDPGGNRMAMIRLVVRLSAERELGFAQTEAAPMILPGDPRPHPYRGPCTQCHAIGKGFELAPDPDLITLPPAPISRDIVLKRLRPHEDRGPCEACHVIQ